MITVQALNNNRDSKMARQLPASERLELPIAMYIDNRYRRPSLTIRGLKTKASKVAVTIMYRHRIKVHAQMVVYSYLGSQGKLVISIGMLHSKMDFQRDMLGLDDDSIHRLVSILVSHLFDFSIFSSQQPIFINLGRCVRYKDGYQNIDPRWYFGQVDCIHQLGKDDMGNLSLYYDGTNTVRFSYELRKLENMEKDD